jgi:hypothetical protein
VYLAASRSHPPAVVQRRQERDVAFVLPLVSELTDTQYRLLLFFQSAIASHAASAVPSLRDDDVAEGAAAAAATLETARKGIIYEHQAISVPAQRLTSALAKVIADLTAQVGSQQARLERDAAVALRGIERGARTAAKGLAGDEPPVYLNLLARMLKAPSGESANGPDGPAPPPPGGGLIITP